MNSAIVEILKNEEFNCRLIEGRFRWLVWDKTEWVVYENRPYARNATVLICTENEQEAVNALVYD